MDLTGFSCPADFYQDHRRDGGNPADHFANIAILSIQIHSYRDVYGGILDGYHADGFVPGNLPLKYYLDNALSAPKGRPGSRCAAARPSSWNGWGSDTAPPGSVYRELVRCPVVCVCRADHPLAALFALQGQIATTVSPDRVLFCENQEALLAMVAAGYAFAVMMDFPQLHNPALRYIPVEGCEPLSFGAAWRAGACPPALRRFVTLLEETLRPAAGEKADLAP